MVNRNLLRSLDDEALESQVDTLLADADAEEWDKLVLGNDAQVDVNTTIDTIVSMSVYLELQPPRFDSKARVFLDEKGQRCQLGHAGSVITIPPIGA